MADLPPWSYTMLDMFGNCPKQAFHKYILKERGPKTEAQIKGNFFDAAIEARLKSDAPLPPELAGCEPMAKSLLLARAPGVKMFTQLKVGITRDFKACAFFAKEVWGRGALDVALIGYPWALINDWKTGKNNEGKPWYNALQLKTFTAFVFKHFPKVDKVTAFNTYTQENRPGKPLTFTRGDERTLWREILGKVIQVEHAFKTQEWPAREGPLCAWCDVVTCNFHPEKK